MVAFAADGRAALSDEHPLMQAEAKYRQEILAQGVTEDLAAYRQLLIQVNQYLRNHGLETESLHYKNPRPYLRIRPNNASPLNRKAQELRARGFKLIYLLPQHLHFFDEKLILFPCYHEYYIALSATALMDTDHLLNSPVLKSIEHIVALQTSAPLHDDALNKIVFYGQNFADLRPINFKTAPHRHLVATKFPQATFIIYETDSIYVPFHAAQEEGFGRHHFRGIDLHKRLAAIHSRIRLYQFPTQKFNSQDPADLTDSIYEANTLAYRLIYSTAWYLLHNTAFFYILLSHPSNVTYAHDPATHTLKIMAHPDSSRLTFYYTLEMPWFDPLPPNGATALLFRSPLLQTYFRYIYAIFSSLEDTEYKFGNNLFSLNYGQLQQLFKEWMMLGNLPEATEKKVRKMLWTLAEFKRKIKLTNLNTANVLNFLDTRHGRALRGCADLVTPPAQWPKHPQNW